MTVVRFDDAEREIRLFLQRFSSTPGLQELVAIRDLMGVFRFAIEGDDASFSALTHALASLEPALGAWLAKSSTARSKTYGRVLRQSELILPQLVFGSLDRIEVAPRAFLLDRRVVAADWRRGPLPNQPPTPPRATFFALKGGAGRSTVLLY